MNLRSSIYLLIVLSIFGISGCSNNTPNPNIPDNPLNPDVMNNPATASGKSTDNVPVIKFDTDVHDFGAMIQGEVVSFAFRFTNTGKGDLIIRSAHGSCGCTVPEYPKDPISPGASGIINVTFNSEGKLGKQNKTIDITSNTIPNSTVVTILADVAQKENK